MVYKVLCPNMLPIKPEHRGKPPSLYDKCTWLFYVHYTTHRTYGFSSHPKDAAMMVVSCLRTQRVTTGTQTQTL